LKMGARKHGVGITRCGGPLTDISIVARADLLSQILHALPPTPNESHLPRLTRLWRGSPSSAHATNEMRRANGFAGARERLGGIGGAMSGAPMNIGEKHVSSGGQGIAHAA